MRARVELEVPFHDVDIGQIAWHGHYYKYFEIARTELMRAASLDVPEIIEMGVHLVVGETRCRYQVPLRYGDRFAVEAWFGELEPYARVHYEITLLDSGKRVARGMTSLLATSPGTLALTEMPHEMVRRMAAFQSRTSRGAEHTS